ncbi:signal transduction histidine kinase [Stackebrandtia albiflava]|uniref:histidine kinase n=1 Tax=Stackebrandtia albiflava TaxID=406432 RepID=A0A562UQN6_9ACTN|nr:histidine kinase [Stackebrandtia albiflava]TWJ07917.1 signal transduction histidine kinase [Stackebrandtia albiflava]
MLSDPARGLVHRGDESRLRLSVYPAVVAGQEAARLTRWFDVVVRWRTAGDLRHGVGVAVVSFAAGAVMLSAGVYTDTGVTVPTWWRFVPLTLVCAGLALRRVAPLTGLALGTAGMAVEVVIGLALVTVCVYTDNLYSATVRGPRRSGGVLLVATVTVSVAVTALVFALTDLRTALSTGSLLAVITVSPVATGIVVMQHREQAELERDRADTIARLAEVDRRAVLAEERTRMARELHDTIANHFSAIAMQSSAVLSRPDMPPETVLPVVTSIRAESVAGLAEMRRTIEFLRANESGDDGVQPRLADVPGVVERMRAAGLAVTTTVEGTERTLPTAVDFAGYRIVQEALTNALKYGRDAVVTIRYLPRELELTVTNALLEGPAALPGSGSGLPGMRERAIILGGECRAGRHGDGWRVHAVLPTPEEDGS